VSRNDVHHVVSIFSDIVEWRFLCPNVGNKNVKLLCTTIKFLAYLYSLSGTNKCVGLNYGKAADLLEMIDATREIVCYEPKLYLERRNDFQRRPKESSQLNTKFPLFLSEIPGS